MISFFISSSYRLFSKISKQIFNFSYLATGNGLHSISLNYLSNWKKYCNTCNKRNLRSYMG